jgi:hypothetical protein
MSKQFCIGNKLDKSLFWDNSIGWVSFESCTRFSELDRDSLLPPVEGFWIEISKMHLYVTNVQIAFYAEDEECARKFVSDELSKVFNYKSDAAYERATWRFLPFFGQTLTPTPSTTGFEFDDDSPIPPGATPAKIVMPKTVESPF